MEYIIIFLLLYILMEFVHIEYRAYKRASLHKEVYIHTPDLKCICEKCGLQCTLEQMSIARGKRSRIDELISLNMKNLLSQGFCVCDKCIYEDGEEEWQPVKRTGLNWCLMGR